MSAAMEVREPSTKYLSALQPPLVQHFELMATALGGVARLRELILTLAVRGKLVPQDSKDTPASELLKQILAEKDRLVSEGKTKPNKPLEPIAEAEQPFDLPISWKWVRFGEVSINRDGERIPVSSNDRDNRAKTYDYYGASGVIDKIDGFLFDKTLLLIGEDGANLLNRSTPIAFLAHGQYWVNNHAHVIDTTHRELMDYLALFINAISLEPYVTGTAQPKMNQAKLNSIVVALPPLAEQSRIVSRVEELMRLCDALEAKGQLEAAQHAQLVQTLLGALTASATPEELADNWQRVATHFDLLLDRPEAIDALEQAILQLAVRGLLVPQDPKDEPASVLLERIRAVKDHLIAKARNNRENKLVSICADDGLRGVPHGWEWSNLATIGIINPRNDASDEIIASFVQMSSIPVPFVAAHVSESRQWGDIKSGFTQFAEDDVGLAKITPCFENGKSTVFQGLSNGIGAGTTELHIVRPLGGIAPRYVLLFLKSPAFLLGGEAVMTGSAGQKRVPRTYFESTPFPLPPLAEQSRIVSRVEELMRLCAYLRQHIASSQSTQAHVAQALIDEVA